MLTRDSNLIKQDMEYVQQNIFVLLIKKNCFSVLSYISQYV